MKEILLAKGGSASAESAVKKVDLTYFDIKKYASGSDIEAALPEKHLFGTAEVYGVIGALIEAQAEGQEGPLKNTGDYNIFYTEKFCVSVRWYSERGGWDVRAWYRGRGWFDGGRVFSLGLEI